MSTSDPNSPTDPPANSTPRSEGATLAGCYALSRKLEVGTGAEVWLARDEVLGKDVSLHFAPDEIRKDARAVQELRLDIKRNRQLIHPNILRVYDLVEEPEWVAVSMDAFEGESIAGLLERVAGRGAPTEEIQPWVNQLAQTLEAAHKINVLHRDLTPANIFLTPAGKLLVGNFGISRTIRDAQTRAGVGELPGLAYGSPQVLDGKPAARTDDVYSLGAILFAVLTGKPPFAGGDLAQQVRAGISADNLALLQSPDLKVPASWKKTIAACLDKNPEARPATAAEVARLLAAPAEEPSPAVILPVETPAAKAEFTSAAPAAIAAATSILRVPGTKPASPGTSDEKGIPASAELKSEQKAPEPKTAEPKTPEPKTPEPKTPEPKTPEPKTPEPKKAREPVTSELKIAPVVVEPKSAPAVAEPKTTPAPAVEKSISAPSDKTPAGADSKAASAVGGLKTAPGTLEAKTAPATVEPKSAPAPAPAEVKSASVADSPKSKTASVELKPEPKGAPGAVELKPLSITEPSKSVAGSATSQKGAETALKDVKKDSEPAKRTGPVPPAKNPDTAPRLYPEDSRFPMMGLAAAAVVIVVIALIYHFAKSGKPSETAGEAPPEKGELRPLSTPPVDSSTPSSTSPVVQTTPPAVPSATPSTVTKAISDSNSALDKARLEAQTADKALADLVKQREAAQADVAGVQKSLDEKVAASKGLKKAIEEVATRRKKLEDDKKAAEAAAAEAQKAAAEKARVAEESAKALADLDKTSAEKMTAPQQAESEIATLQKTLGEKQRAMEDGAKALALAEAAKQQKLAAVTDREREIERLKSADEEAMKQREAEAAEKSRLDSELAELKRKMDEIENRQKQFKNPSAASPAPKPVQTPAALSTPRLATPVPVLSTPKGNTPPPAPATPVPATPVPATPAPATPPKMALLTTPAPVIPATPAPNNTVAGGNSLGMKFVPVGDVEFCIWQTRLRDFEVFAKAVNLKSTSWKGPGFKQAPEHPVVNISWQEAIAFCKWLTDKEHKDNTLPANLFYRLPTDLEWSKAVGLPEEPGRTPEMRDMQIPDVYPWGNQWPPPAGAGNYTGEETGSDVAIKGYDDGFAWTSPVGSFPPNKYGIYDMGGNVWQWCMDTWNADSKAKVLRGASWYNGALKLSLLSSCRIHAAPDSSTDNYGFRIVRAKEDGKAGKK